MESRDPRGPIFNAKPGANGAREVFKHEMGLKVRDPDQSVCKECGGIHSYYYECPKLSEATRRRERKVCEKIEKEEERDAKIRQRVQVLAFDPVFIFKLQGNIKKRESDGKKTAQWKSIAKHMDKYAGYTWTTPGVQDALIIEYGAAGVRLNVEIFKQKLLDLRRLNTQKQMRTRSESTGRLHTALIEANEEIEKENEESKITNREINDRLTKIEVMQKALRHVERDSKTGLQNLQACTNTVLTEYNKKYTNRMSKLEEEVASTKTQVTVNNTSVNQTLSALGQAVDTQKEIHTEIKTLIVSRDTTVGQMDSLFSIMKAQSTMITALNERIDTMAIVYNQNNEVTRKLLKRQKILETKVELYEANLPGFMYDIVSRVVENVDRESIEAEQAIAAAMFDTCC